MPDDPVTKVVCHESVHIAIGSFLIPTSRSDPCPAATPRPMREPPPLVPPTGRNSALPPALACSLICNGSGLLISAVEGAAHDPSQVVCRILL